MGCHCCAAAGRALATAQADIARLEAELELELERQLRGVDEPTALAHARRTIDDQRRQLAALRSAHRELVSQLTGAMDELEPVMRGAV